MNPIDRSISPVLPQLYLPPVPAGEPLLAAKFVDVRLLPSFQEGVIVPAGDIFQADGNDAEEDKPITSKFSVTGELSAILICAFDLNVNNTNKKNRREQIDFITFNLKMKDPQKIFSNSFRTLKELPVNANDIFQSSTAYLLQFPMVII